MSAALDMITGTLPATATYASRSYVWFPATPGVYPDGRIGTLHITLQRSARPGAKVEHDSYAVAELRDVSVPGKVSVFTLRNNATGDSYRCAFWVGAVGVAACTCKASTCGSDCKHLAALAALLKDGVL
jgi:hypothetical protein